MASQKDYQPVEMEEAEAVEAQVVAEAVPTVAAVKATALPMIEVVAPATLSEGYTFEAEVGDRVITVTVPPGGVEEGQRFMVPAKALSTMPTSQIPVGAWRDSLFDCCKYGCCHAQVCLSYWCGPCALGQVMQRMHLSWIGTETGPAAASVTCRTVAFLFGAYLATDYFLALIEKFLVPPVNSTTNNGLDPYHTNTSNPQGDVNPLFYLFYTLRMVLNVGFMIYMLVAMSNTRRYIRRKYAIREQRCKGMEDCCCAFWCHCCTIAQMARHTADYDTYNASCCSETGLPPAAPAIV